MANGALSFLDLSGERQQRLVRAVGAVLAEADADIAGRKPVCRASGLCCKFEEYGHRMYVTHAELAYFAARVEEAAGGATKNAKSVSLPQFFSQEAVRGCPYQVEGLCTAREARPLGCRIYFCDAGAQGWQNEVYERYHGKLKTLHDEFDLPYGYVEWREGLRMIAGRSAQATGRAGGA